MPRHSKGARLWLQPSRRDQHGRIVEQAVWVIRDSRLKRSTGFGHGEAAEAERALADYIAIKYRAPRISNLNFFGATTLAGINRKSCDAYVRQRGAQAAARRELEDLRAALRHHWAATMAESAKRPGDGATCRPLHLARPLHRHTGRSHL